MNQQPSVFLECGADRNSEKYPFTRKHYVQSDMELDEFRRRQNNTGVYNTVMHYINPIWFQNERNKWIINARDSYKWGDFYLDFDTVIESESDYQKIREDVKTALKYFRTFLQVNIDQVQFFFSGNKGMHLTVSAETLGLQAHTALNQIYKDIAVDIEQYCKHKTLDLRVYDDKRMFRMVNSINKKSGLYKIPLTPEEFQQLSYAEIAELARMPRVIERPKPILSLKASKMFQKYVEEWTNRVEKQREYTGKLMELKVNPPCIQNMLDRTFRETIDERNNSGTALASFFYQQNMDRNEALARLIKWGEENCIPALKPREMEIIVNSVYNSQYRYGCGTFEKLSGVCDKANCPLFNREVNKTEGKTDEH